MFSRPWTFFVVAMAGWMNRNQQDVVAYLREENRILREHLGRKRLILSVAQKQRLATKGKRLGRQLLGQVGTLFTPDTILKWLSLPKTPSGPKWALTVVGTDGKGPGW